MPVFACIGWGSLLWDPRSLPMAEPFRSDGPRLPIEFSRVSLDGRVTLVIDPEAAEMATWWCALGVDSVEAAVAALGRRERIAAGRWTDWIAWQARDGARVGGTPGSAASGMGGAAGAAGGPGAGGAAVAATRSGIARWLDERDVDAVVWTALPARTPDGRLDWPTTDALLVHLRGLGGAARARAEEYVRRAPATIDSARRRRFAAELGWTPSDVAPNPPTPGREEDPR